MKYSLNLPSLSKKEISYVNSALKSNWLSFEGKNTRIFEKKFKTKINDLSQKEFNKIYHKYEIILLRFQTFLKYNKKHNIKYILSPTTGTNHIDSNFFKDKRVKVFTLRDEKNFLKKIPYFKSK